MRSSNANSGRHFIPRPVQTVVLVAAMLTVALTPRNLETARAQTRHPGANEVTWRTLKASHRIRTSYRGNAQALAKLQGGAAALAMASADFDGDGIADLVVGFAHGSGGVLALHQGNIDAIAPRSHASWLAIAHEQFPDPFLPQATLIDLPEVPQFIVTGDFTGNGDLGILVGARGSQYVYLLTGDGTGRFSAPQKITLPGTLSALAAGEVGVNDGKTDVVAAVKNGQYAAVVVYKGSAGGLTQTGVSYPVPEAATQLEIGDLHGDGFDDVAVLAGSEVLIVHPTAASGDDTSALVEHVPVGGGARSIAVGGFVWDRHDRNQLAVLGQSGIVQVLSPDELDTRPYTAEERFALRSAALRGEGPAQIKEQWAGQSEAWNVVKSASVSAPMGGNVRLIGASLAHARPLDLMVVDSSDTRVHVLPANTSVDPGDAEPAELTIDTGDAPMAVLPMRVNSDARRGLVMMGRTSSQPLTMAPLPDPTYFVNRLDDPAPGTVSSICNNVSNADTTSSCSFRESVIKANATSGTDSIMLPAGTITLTRLGQKENAASTGDVDVLDSVNITGTVDGSGNPTSIITGGASWNDKFISTNKVGVTSANLSIQNVTFQGGNNTNTNSPPDPAFNFLGGALDFYGCDAVAGGCSGQNISAMLTISNVHFVNNTDAGCTGNICGGGLDAEFGPVAIGGSLFSGNHGAGQGGGLSLVGAKETMTVTNTTFTGNSAGTDGGAILVNFQNPAGTGNVVAIHNSSFSGNTSVNDGAAMYINLQQGTGGTNVATASIDQGSVFSGNTSSARGGAIAFAGVSGSASANTSLTISKVTITGNHTGASSDGGAILMLDSGTLNMSFSRIVGNTAPAGKPTGVTIEPATSTLNLNNNWWGCNTGPSAAPCDTVGVISGSPTINDNQWIVLKLTASPTTLQPQAPGTTSSSLTADFLHDSNNNAVSLSNIDVLLGLPISFGGTGGSISGAQTNIQSSGTATATFTKDGTCNAASATATVDTNPPPTVTANLTTVCPDLTATKLNTAVNGGPLALANAVWQWYITIGNSSAANSAPALFNDGQTILSDTLPGGNISYGTTVVNANVPNSANISCAVNSNVLTCKASGGAVTIGPGQMIQVYVQNVTASAGGSYTNPAAGGCTVDPDNDVIEFIENNNSCGPNTVIVVAPPTISKAFGAVGVPVGGTTTLTFTLTNPAANTVSETGVAFSDTLTGGLQVASTPNVVSTCGGSVTASANSTSVSLSGGTINASSSCTISLNVTGTTAGIVTNTTGAVSSTNGGTGVGSNTATLKVANPPTISKAFAVSSIPLNASTTVTFTITNPNPSGVDLSGIAFSDSLPSGLVVAGTPNTVDHCGGTVTASGSSISLSGGALTTATHTCTISVDVTGTSAGPKANTTGVITATESGTAGAGSNTAFVIVVAPPSISKAFSPSTVPLGNDAPVIFTIANPNVTGLSNVGFSDTLTGGLVISNSPGTTNSCNGTVTAVAGSTSISLSGGMVTGGTSCAISLNVTPPSATSYTDQTGTVSSTEGGIGAASNLASLTVVTPACDTPPSGMIDWWSGDNDGNDVTGPNPLTLVGGANFAGGEVGAAFNFTNAPNAVTGQYAQNTAPTGLPVGNAARSIDLWFNSGTDLSAAGLASLINYGANQASESFGLMVGPSTNPVPGKLFFFANSNNLSGVTTIDPNTWYHAAVTYDGTTLVLYLNGAVESTRATTGNPLNTVLDASGITVGLTPATATWNGQIDEVEIFNRALTATEVHNLYLAGNQGKCRLNATIAKSFTPAAISVNGTSTISFTVTNPNASVNLTGVSFTDSLPSGLVVATPPNASTTCGSTFNPPPSATSLSFSGGTVAAGSSCAVKVNVTGSTPGSYDNTTSAISTTEAGTGATSNTANLKIVAPATISKGFAPGTVALHGNSTLTFTITNPNSGVALSLVSFGDTFPAGLQVAATPGASNGCGGTFSAAANATSVSLSGGALAAGASCTLTVSVTGVTGGAKNNTTGPILSVEGGAGAPSNTATLLVGNAATISKAFLPTSIPAGSTSTLSLTISNPNSFSLTGLAFSDTFPAGLQVASPLASSDGCGGTFTPLPGGNSINLSGGTVSGNSSCTVSVSVTAASAGTLSNTTGSLSSNEGGTGSGSNTATLTVLGPPGITKSFSPATVPLGNESAVVFMISNPDSSSGLSSVAFSDTLPSGLKVAASPGVNNSCNGTVTASPGSGTIGFSGGTVVAGGSCAISVNVTPASATTYSNSTGPISSTEGGTGPASNSATLTVVTPACFVPPSGMIDWWSGENAPNDIVGPNDFTLQGGAGYAAGEVGQAFNFTNSPNSATGQYAQNTAPTGLPVTNAARTIDLWFNTGTDLTTSSDSALIEYGTQTSENVFGLVFSATAPGKLYFDGGGDDLAGTTVIAPNTWYHAAVTYDGTHLVLYLNGVAEATKNTTSLSTTLDADGLTLGLRPGVSTFNGQIDEVEIFNRALSATEINNLYLAGNKGKCKTGPSIAKSFSPTSIPVNGTSTVSFTVTNPNASVNLTGVSFVDNLPSGLAVTGPPVVTTGCNGGVSTQGGSGGSITQTGGTVAANSSCTVTVTVTSAAAETYNNTTGNLSTTETGTGDPSNTATLTVIAPPTISKAFSPTSVPVNGNSTLTFTLTNPNSSLPLSGLSFSDNFPAGLQVATAPAAVDNCGGIFAATSGGTSVALGGGTLASGASCTISVSVTGTTGGAKLNTTGTISSTEGGTGATSNTATLTVGNPATITKSFNPSSVPVNGTSTLGFTITNPNASLALTGVSFTDPLPAGVQVAANPNATNSCSGTLSAAPSATTVGLSSGAVTAGGSCTITVSVIGATAGAKLNTTGPLSSNEGGAGSTSNTATLTVVAPPTISKGFGAPTVPLNGLVSLSFTISNPNAISLSGVSFSDTLPAGLKVSATLGVTSTCGGTFNAPANATAVSLTSGAITPSSSCTISLGVTGTSVGLKSNTTGAVSSTESGAGTGSNTAIVTVVAPPTIAKGFSPTNVALNGNSTLTFTIANPNATQALSGVSFADTFPTGLQVAATPGAINNCGGTFTATASTGSVSLAGGSVGASISCTLSVTVTGTAPGTLSNTTGAISSTEGGTGTTSNTAALLVGTPATITKAFSPTSIQLGGTSTLTFTLKNPGTQTLTGLFFTDSFPSGIQVNSSPSASNGCGGTFTAAANSTSVGLSGGSLAAGKSCTLSVKVKGATSGVFNNITGPLSSTQAGAGQTSNTATLTVIGLPVIVKAFGAPSIPLNGTTTVTFNITNPNSTVVTAVSFGDPLPSGLKVASSPGVSNTCGGTLSASANSSSINLSNGSVGAGGSCAISVNVTGTSAGVKNNTTGALSCNKGTGNTSNTATLVVVGPPTISKAFGATTVAPNGNVQLSFSISNANTVALSNLTFSDVFPAGLKVATAPGGTNSCGGTFTAAANATSVGLSGGGVPANSSCAISLTVTATTTGVKNNTTGAISATQSGTGKTSNTASITVASPAGLTFSPTSINFGTVTLWSSTTQTLTVTNAGSTTVKFTNVSLSNLQNISSSHLVLHNDCDTSFSAGKTCTMKLTLSPTSTGPVSAMLNLTDNATGSPQHIQITATVIAPKANLNSSSLDFSSHSVNSSTVKTFTLSNPGVGALTISSFKFSGSNSADFSQTNNCGSSLAAGSTCTISVTFKPKATGSRSATLTMTDNAQSPTQTVSLSGKGT